MTEGLFDDAYGKFRPGRYADNFLKLKQFSEQNTGEATENLYIHYGFGIADNVRTEKLEVNSKLFISI